MACHVCGSGDGVRLYEGSDKKFRGPGRFTYVRCRPCGLVYLHPRLSDRELSRYYPDYVTPVSTASGSSSWERMRQRLKRMVAAEWYGYSRSPGGTSRWPFRPLRKALTLPLSPLLSQVPRAQAGGRVLDIGCGSGGYLAFLASLGWACVGIEPGPQSRAYAQDVLGLTVHAGPLTACALPEASFSVATMWHVIEHLPDPLKTLREIHRLLKADGIVMLRTPNVDSFGARLFRGNWYGLDPPRHLYLFSPRTIRALLERSGFAITRLRYQYHAHDCSRSLLYLAEDRGLQSLRQNLSAVESFTGGAPYGVGSVQEVVRVRRNHARRSAKGHEMKEPPHLWDSGERVPPESHNTLYQELFSAYKAARNVSQKGLVLDVGCGAGYGANYLAEAGCRVVGIDYEPAVARAAACRYRRRGLHFSCMDGTRLGLRSGSVDVACAFQVLEHFSEPEQFLTELVRVLRPDGLVILSTPNALIHVGPTKNPFHEHEFTPEELKTLLRRHFACVLLAGQHRPSDVYLLERACQQVRRWDVVGIKRILPRKLISLLVHLIARWNHLPPPQGMGLQTFPITPDTDKAYSIFAMCGQSPLPELGFQQTGTP